MDILGEGLPPDVGVASGVKVDSTHTRFGCVGGTEKAGVLRDNLSEVGRAGAQTGSEAGKGGEVVLDGRGEAHSAVGRLVEGELQGAEKAGGARDGDGYNAQFAEDLFPALASDALLASEINILLHPFTSFDTIHRLLKHRQLLGKLEVNNYKYWHS